MMAFGFDKPSPPSVRPRCHCDGGGLTRIRILRFDQAKNRHDVVLVIGYHRMSTCRQLFAADQGFEGVRIRRPDDA